MEENIFNTLSAAGKALTEEPTRITITVTPINALHRKLQQWGLCKRKREYFLYPVKTGTLYRLSELLLSIDNKDFEDVEDLNKVYAAIMKHQKKLIRCIAIAIHNRKSLWTPMLEKTLLRELSVQDIFTIVLVVRKCMHTQSFISSIVLLKGASILEAMASPTSQAETIAPGAL
jgi:hypothetical protein